MKKSILLISLLAIPLTACETKIYVVQFDTDGGGFIPSQGVKSGGYATLPEIIPQKDGFRFLEWQYNEKAWNFDSDQVISDMTLKAFYEQTKFEVKVEYNNEMGSVTGAGYYDKDDNVSLIAQAKENYSFESWTIDGEIVSKDPDYEFVMPNHDVILAANFVESSYHGGWI